MLTRCFVTKCGHCGFGCSALLRTYFYQNKICNTFNDVNKFSLDVKVLALNPVLACWSWNDRRQSMSLSQLCSFAYWCFWLTKGSTEGLGICLYDSSPVPWLLCGTDMTEGVSLGHGLSLTACLTIVFDSLPLSFFCPYHKNQKQINVLDSVHSVHYQYYVMLYYSG